MRIGILTITDGQNYGNRLQNYALQTLLEELSFDVETLLFRTQRDGYRKYLVYQNFAWLIKKILKKQSGKHKIARLRKLKFDSFNNNYIKFSKFIISDKKIPRSVADAYEYFVCGSDQIWNPRIAIVNENIKCHLACFARPKQRIAYAASFGINSIPDTSIKLFKDELLKFKAIGVREKQGEIIIANCCGRKDVQTVLDPTMMLTNEAWLRIAKKPNYITSSKPKFIVTYFLSEESNILKNYIEAVSNKHNADVIRLNIEFLLDEKIDNKEYFCTSPDEFIWLIANSECVLTDSFHATVFSLIFHKPFCVFERKATEKGNNMESRIDTLLGYFGLECMKGDINNPKKTPQPYDGNMVDDILKIKRAESIAFLKKALDLNK